MGQELTQEVKFGEGISNEDLGIQIQAWIDESKTYHDYLLQRQKVSEQYYLGNQTKKESIPSYLTDTVENRIFEAVETVVPIVSSAAHKFVIFPGSESQTSQDRAESLSKVLDKKYRTLEMQKKIEEATRALLLYRFGVLKWEWNYPKDDINVRVIDPRLILIPKLRVDPHDLPYKIECQEYTREEIKDYFPELTDKQMLELEMSDKTLSKGHTKVESKKTFQVFEVWTSDYVVWFSNKKILDKKINPYFDFEGTTTTTGKGKDAVSETKFSNFFDDPRDPYVFLTTYNIGDEPIGSISLVEEAIPIQDAINTQKRQIIDNLRRMGNGELHMDDDAMTDETANNITSEPGGIIKGEALVSGNKIRRVPGLPLPNAHFANYQSSNVSFDNIFGIHPASRGAGAAKTLGQDIISKQQDLSRIDLITRVINRGVQKVAEGLVQLMKMFYDTNHVMKILGEDGAVEFVSLNSNEIEQTIEIDVKTGRSPEMDKIQLANQAIQLWQLKALAPQDLFEKLEFPEPEKAAERLLLWTQGQLDMETQAEIQRAAAGAGAKAATTPEKEGEGRGTEQPGNVLQRATQNLGGTAEIPGKTSNV